MNNITFIHTADIHLGRKFLYLKDKSIEAREHLFDILEKIVNIAIEKNVKFLIISGDLFDSNNPSMYVVAKFLDSVSLLEKHKIKIILLPGTHDYLKANGIYSNSIFNSYKNLYIFNDPSKKSIEFEDLSLGFYAYPPISNKMKDSPIVGFDFNNNLKYRIILAHGSVQITGKSAFDDSPITLDEIKNSNASYIALGHWHQNIDFSNTVPCFYSGSPELIDLDQINSGFVMYGDLNNNKFEKIKVGERFFDEIIIPIDSIKSREKLIEQIISNADRNLIRKVNIIGKKNESTLGLNFDLIRDEIYKYFYYLIIDDKSYLDIDLSIDYDNLSSIEKAYIDKMKNLIDNSKTEEEKDLYKESLELGYALLQGRFDLL